MLEIRQSGSEGGAAMSRSYPYRQLFKVASFSNKSCTFAYEKPVMCCFYYADNKEE